MFVPTDNQSLSRNYRWKDVILSLIYARRDTRAARHFTKSQDINSLLSSCRGASATSALHHIQVCADTF